MKGGDPAASCITCGKPLPLGSRGRAVRCRTCNNRLLNAAKAEEVRKQDGWLLSQVALGKPVAEIAEELGISRQAVYQRLAKAKQP